MVKNDEYEMSWYMYRDTAKMEIGKVLTQVKLADGKVCVVTEVKLNKQKNSWIDSSIATEKDLGPIYHSSYNAQRDMVLNFGTIVTGYYNDKIKKNVTYLSDTTTEKYFDSNFYPSLIKWLRLKEGMKEDIAIYDYNPAGKMGVLKASITGVSKGNYTSAKSGGHAVWLVSVSDEISENATTTYYIDRADRKLWKMETGVKGRKMVMETIEE